MQESWEGLGGKQAQEGQQWRGKLARKVREPLGKKGPFYRPSKMWPLQPRSRPDRILRLVSDLGTACCHTRAQIEDFCVAPESPAKSHRILRSWKTGKNSNTKTVITWASELRFWWTWARFEDNNELYKIMQRNIIVQHGRTKPNEERFDLSINDESVKPPTSKTQYDIHSRSVFDELELVMEISTSSKSSHG